MIMKNCPVCERIFKEFGEDPRGGGVDYYNCFNCSAFFLPRETVAEVRRMPVEFRAALSRRIWLRRFDQGHFFITPEILRQIPLELLCGPVEQLENLITFWGEAQGEHVGTPLQILYTNMRATIGAITAEDVRFITQEACRREWLRGKEVNQLPASSRYGKTLLGGFEGVLTFEGWEAYERLQQGRTESRNVFMAMPFGYPEVTNMVDTVFRPAVAATGFRLRRLDDDAPAGLIDHRMRVEIRGCRFLIADLTHGNHGAYWEAGYAEGLGKPVIYTCSKPHFDEHKTHFDTNHCTTVIWDPAAPEKAAKILQATIRATFPEESTPAPDPPA